MRSNVGRRRRDRHGRGLRGVIAPANVPLARTRSERFDDLVLDAVEELEAHWAAELAGVEFAVEEVPPAAEYAGVSDIVSDSDSDTIVDRGVPLGRLLRTGVPGTSSPVIVVYRRAVEARAADLEDRGDLVFMVVAELVAELLGRDIDEIDPPS